MRYRLVPLMLALACAPSAPVTVKGGMRLLLSPSGVQTMSPLDGGATGRYYDWGELAGYLRPNAKRVVLLGLGGGEMLRAARRSLPKAELIGVEVDPLVARAAVRAFHVEDFGVEVVVADAREWVQHAPAGSVDVLFVDVFEDMTLPPFFRSPGFFRECRRVVGPGGAVLMNVWPRNFDHSVARAMRRGGFDEVVAIDAGNGNAVLWAGAISGRTAPAWLGLEQRYVP